MCGDSKDFVNLTGCGLFRWNGEDYCASCLTHEMDEKDDALAEKDRVIAALRAEVIEWAEDHPAQIDNAADHADAIIEAARVS